MSDDIYHLHLSSESQHDANYDHLKLEMLEHLANDAGKVVFVISFATLLSFLVGNLLHRYHISFVPESLVVVAVGACIGMILPTGSSSRFESWWTLTRVSINQEGLVNKLILDVVLLPIIIFEAGWSLRHRDFMSQLTYTLIFAIFGTLISMGIVGGLIMSTSDYHGVSNPQVAFAFAALISAVDPVATLATYSSLNVDPLLNTFVFGESVLNDAVAIVLFHTLNYTPPADFEHMSGGSVAGTLSVGVLQLLGLAALLGVALGGLFCIVLRISKIGLSTSMSALFILTSAFFAYNLSESICNKSGIITNLFMAIVMGGYAPAHLTAEGTMMTSFLLKQMASLADMFVFLFVGIAVVYVQVNGLTFGLWVLLFCMVGRLIGTVPLGILTNFLKNWALRKRPAEKRHLLSWRHIFMMWHAGLRGGIALMLTLELGDWVDDVNGIGTKEKLRNATLVSICGFLLFSGGTTKLCLTLLDIPMGGSGQLEHHRGGESRALRKKINKCVQPILVGSKPGRQISHEESEEGHVLESIFADLFARKQRQQQQEEQLESDGNGDIQGVQEIVEVDAPSAMTSMRSNSSSWAAERYSMFGTIDPCHFDEMAESRRPVPPAQRARLLRRPSSRVDMQAPALGSSSSSGSISESDEENST
mmetsp:Transcript_14888/g.32155  ORF Transcript_14888/g.32155 Transcript_14888/m.32155 type:complete len:648 (-) Transcript_14888:42-1985(-)